MDCIIASVLAISFAGSTPLEPFYPDRMASRILGMGDVLSLIDKVQQNIDEQEALEMQKKMRSNEKITSLCCSAAYSSAFLEISTGLSLSPISNTGIL